MRILQTIQTGRERTCIPGLRHIGNLQTFKADIAAFMYDKIVLQNG
ncbi:hypothetical protein T4D_7139 [Trichinella pseudospiralis]|uniref:Uncharacterized protein n=1 Tax=Trichinella pseudospiralis TaxID=6337 RepID=A0A0V1F2G2_TRIPS|nr:hypothetical protein T4D_7139 [Trichinella pseudospiralis]